MLQLNTFIMKINSRLSATPILSLLTILTLTFTSCKKDNSVNEPVVYGDASLKVVNTVQGSLAQDFFQNDTKISTTPVAYGEATGYLTIKAGNSTISYKNTGSTTVNATAGLGLNTNDSFTVFSQICILQFKKFCSCKRLDSDRSSCNPFWTRRRNGECEGFSIKGFAYRLQARQAELFANCTFT